MCDNSNPNAEARKRYDGIFRIGAVRLLAHIWAGYAGGQAQYARIPFADVGLLNVPDHLADENVLFLSDIFPTAYMAAENAIFSLAIRSPSGVAARWAVRHQSAYMLGAERVIAIDRIPERWNGEDIRSRGHQLRGNGRG